MQKVLKVLQIVLLTVVFGLLVILGVVSTINYIANKDVEETYAQIEDSALLSCETCTDYVNDLVLLYSIGDTESYEKARKTVNMSEDMYNRFFSVGEYVGTKHRYTCRIADIQYSVPETKDILTADATYEYMVTLQQTDLVTDTVTTYIVLATYTDGELCDLIVL